LLTSLPKALRELDAAEKHENHNNSEHQAYATRRKVAQSRLCDQLGIAPMSAKIKNTIKIVPSIAFSPLGIRPLNLKRRAPAAV